jgi:hypothetical protein
LRATYNHCQCGDAGTASALMRESRIDITRSVRSGCRSVHLFENIGTRYCAIVFRRVPDQQ